MADNIWNLFVVSLQFAKNNDQSSGLLLNDGSGNNFMIELSINDNEPLLKVGVCSIRWPI